MYFAHVFIFPWRRQAPKVVSDILLRQVGRQSAPVTRADFLIIHPELSAFALPNTLFAMNQGG